METNRRLDDVADGALIEREQRRIDARVQMPRRQRSELAVFQRGRAFGVPPGLPSEALDGVAVADVGA